MASASRQNENPNPRVGVGVLLVDEAGRVLLTLRERPPEAGCWSIVGGKVDYLETLEQCAVRETREEVGLEIRLAHLLCVTDHHLPHEGQHWVSPAYLGQVLAGEDRNCEPEKTRAVGWFPLGELPRISPSPPKTPSQLTSARFLRLPALLFLRKTDH
jgi:ADP-ribose pyrophosphatase